MSAILNDDRDTANTPRVPLSTIIRAANRLTLDEAIDAMVALAGLLNAKRSEFGGVKPHGWTELAEAMDDAALTALELREFEHAPTPEELDKAHLDKVRAGLRGLDGTV